MIDLAFDGLRVGHMASFAVGIGAAAFLEMQIVKRFRHGIDIDGLRLLLNGHALIKAAIVGLWLTGLGLMFFRLVVIGDPFTAKLGAKLAVVTLLSLNMVIIDRFLIPELFLYEDAELWEMPSLALAEFGAIAGFSAGAWASALLLGGIGRFKTMDAFELFNVLVPLLVAATLAGAAAALVTGRVSPPVSRGRMVPGE